MKHSSKFTGLMCLAFAASASGEDWRMYLHDPAHTSVNRAESQLNKINVGSLKDAWTLHLDANLAAAVTVADGALYFGDWDGYFYAVRAADGKILWKQFVGLSAEPEEPQCQPALGVTSQATVSGNTVYVGGGDSAVYAFDRNSGRELWRVPLADPATGSYLWSSITLSANSLFIGVSSLGDCPLVQGVLARIDLSNPTAPVLRYLAPPDNPGGGIWSTPAIDEATNTVFITTGTGDQDPDNGVWGSALMSLDATTLETKSYYFMPLSPEDGDIEWGSSPTLFETPDGSKWVAAAGKDGILYVLSRDDLSLRWTRRLSIKCICPECGCGSLSTPAFDGKLLYVGAGISDLDTPTLGSIYAIDPSKGQPVWMHQLDGPVIAPPTVANGLVYVSTMAGARVFDAESGNQLWSDRQWGRLYSQSVVVNGTLYTAYWEGQVVAWRLPQAKTSNSSRTPSGLVNRDDH